jgi:hypothetical protein
MSDLIAFIYKNAAAFILAAAAVAAGVIIMVVADMTNFTADLAETVANLNSLYHGYPDFSSMSNQVAYNNSPSSMHGTGNTLITPWNGTVTFSVDANPSMYDIAVTNIPDSQCSKTATALGSGVQSVSVNGTAFTSSANGVDPGEIEGACGSTGTGTNSVTYVIGK